MTDWVAWHRDYDDPSSRLSRRLAVVQGRLRQALDRAPPGPVRLVSLCAGDGRDVVPVLATHPRGGDVRAVLVELDPVLAGRAGASAPAVDVRRGDAGDVNLFADAVPVDVLLLCGIFGNVSTEDIATTVAAVRTLTRPGGSVLWTRGTSEPDLRPYVRRLFVDNGFAEAGFDGGPDGYGVGWAIAPEGPAPEAPVPADRPVPRRLFTFIR